MITLEDYVLKSKKHESLKSKDGSYQSFHEKSNLLLEGAKLGAEWFLENSCKDEKIKEFATKLICSFFKDEDGKIEFDLLSIIMERVDKKYKQEYEKNN